MRKFFRWDGTYAAFERVGRVYRPDGSYLGWIDKDGTTVWRADGSYLGEIVDDIYIQRNVMRLAPMPRIPRIPPIPPIPPVRPMNRMARVPRVSWQEAL